jgi:CheY-like chemotaxis protein
MSEEKVKILIVDDIEDNRMVIRRICRKFEGVELLEAENGQIAVDIVRDAQPQIVLMDVMMPVMDGFEASTIIKSEYPEINIIVITALVDDETEKNFLKLGVDGYLRKPVSREILTVKVEGLLSAIKVKSGEMSLLTSRQMLNPFAKVVRKMKTVFMVDNEEDMMNLGTWLSEYYHRKNSVTTMDFDFSIDFIYRLLTHIIKVQKPLTVLIEEDFDHAYLTFVLPNGMAVEDVIFDFEERIKNNIVVRSGMLYLQIHMICNEQPEALMAQDFLRSALSYAEDEPQTEEEENEEHTQEAMQGSAFISDEEKALLRASFIEKISAVEFVGTIGDTLKDEIADLGELDVAWREALDAYENKPSKAILEKLSDETIHRYAKVVNEMYEFHGLGYGLSSLAMFLKTTDEALLLANAAKIVLLLRGIIDDLSAWQESIFVTKIALDIHYLDSSLLSSCIQIDMMVNQKQIEGDDDELELF